MEDKIYEKLKEQEKQTTAHYIKVLNLDKNLELGEELALCDTIPKKNIDLEIILNNLGLIDANCETHEKINEFHDYLIKYGINLGIGNGKKLFIEAIKDGKIDFEAIMDIDPEDCVSYDLKPMFIKDIKEMI